MPVADAAPAVGHGYWHGGSRWHHGITHRTSRPGGVRRDVNHQVTSCKTGRATLPSRLPVCRHRLGLKCLRMRPERDEGWQLGRSAPRAVHGPSRVTQSHAAEAGLVTVTLRGSGLGRALRARPGLVGLAGPARRTTNHESNRVTPGRAGPGTRPGPRLRWRPAGPGPPSRDPGYWYQR